MISINDFKKEVLVWAEKVRVKPAEIHVRKMRRKWASCSNKGRLTFSYDLLSKPEDFRAYVIVHELLHLRYPNHGKMFKVLLRMYLEGKS
jgi:predicted metal-dependent hydrolase